MEISSIVSAWGWREVRIGDRDHGSTGLHRGFITALASKSGVNAASKRSHDVGRRNEGTGNFIDKVALTQEKRVLVSG